MAKEAKSSIGILGRVNKYYGIQKPDDEHEALYLSYVEKMRIKSNLQRTVYYCLFLLLYLILIFITPIVRALLNTKLLIGELIGAVGIILFVLVARTMCNKISDATKTVEKKYYRTSKFLYTFFWSMYFLITIFPTIYFAHEWILVMVIWMPLVALGFMVPVYSLIEGVPATTCAIVSVVFFIYEGLSTGSMTLPELLSAIPAAILVIVVTDINHVERLNAFYYDGKNMEESSASRRRLGNVFDEVFDIAFEINLSTGECVMLRDNEHYNLNASNKKEMPIGDLYRYAYGLIHPDDTAVFARAMGVAHIENEFITLGATQIYTEARLLTADDNYEWVSFLLTKESNISDDNNIYVLCLVQNIQERKDNEDKLKLEAEKDPLTQLYNKMTTKSLIEECLEKNPTSQHALLILDIDNFKTINDTRGHTVGDQIIVAFANELSRNFRESDILGRAGGDEFVVLLKNVQSVAMICDKLQRLSSSFKKYGIDNGFPGRLSTSIGVALFNKDGKTYEELFKKADAALYEAKRNGKDQYKFSISRSE